MNRSVKIQAPPSGALRSGYSLLELMIALSLLSVLVVLVWSLLSTFTTAESRGERAAQRIQ
ncbi:MAG: prepilin-type N-terminal cleavage/methylation domain-containing protein, partial [Planctomycetota bacterium]|nr:prepilin-type N-terminal cleavage/methylation domain-containing protein [Planctomycetota bacterium]